MIDAHIHADTRSYEDFEAMSIAGVDAAITCAHDPLRMSTSAVVLDHFHRIMTSDVRRAKDNGIKLYTAIGIHPRSICKDFEVVLNVLPSHLENENVVAIGEIGLETASRGEREVFRKQLTMAQDLGMKVIVHTPRSNKRETTTITLSLIKEYIDPSLVQIDHVNASILDLLLDFEGILGITVQPQKMTPQEAIELLEEYGYDKFVLDSDMSSSPSDILSVPKTVHRLKIAGIEDSNIKKVSLGNVTKFYGI